MGVTSLSSSCLAAKSPQNDVSTGVTFTLAIFIDILLKVVNLSKGFVIWNNRFRQ